ncbi:unnamed protein product [Moneuplotes crassus]|uniref:Uncharacterized protein n=1 Tax=Euplotes crassus TaxID=5936 RepID=A0AAD1UQ90_EUPCR|nr:unnamed protein product [Moneuplotes crassus]
MEALLSAVKFLKNCFYILMNQFILFLSSIIRIRVNLHFIWSCIIISLPIYSNLIYCFHLVTKYHAKWIRNSSEQDLSNFGTIRFG